MKIWVLTKKTGVLYAAMLVFLVLLIYAGRSESLMVSKTNRDLPIYNVEKAEDDKIISISFDAAWGNEDTDDLISILDKYGVKTTFFVVGEWAEKYPESVKQLSDAGHEVMNHSDTHPHMPKLSVEDIKKEISNCDDKIEKVTGKRPFLFRPPYGDYDNKTVQALRELGHYTIQWDVDSLDWKDLSANEMYSRVIPRIKPGSIVLFHNAAKNTPEALPRILEKLQEDGYRIVPISELIMRENFYVDHTGMQKPNITESPAPQTI